jgi:glycosyltransferase involved in cell wall biosynthesis
MEKLKVLHVADKLSLGGSTLHGVSTLFSWWLPRFDHERFDVRLCSLRSRDKAGEYLEGLGIKVYYMGRGKYDLRALIDLLDLVKREKFQLLHLHGYGSCTFGRLAGRVLGVPAVVHEHMYDPKVPVYQRLADRMLSRSTAWSIAVSQSVKDFLIYDRSLSEKNLQILYNGAPLSFFSTNTGDADPDLAPIPTWKEKLGIPAENRVVASVGRLHPVKGLTYFLQAAQQVQKVYKQVTFLVVGDGELMEPLREESRSLGIEENVLFMGYCGNVPSLLKEADIMVISSLSEGIPLTLFEAMAAGCPVVSTDVGGIKEILQDSITGFLVPSKDAAALADRIILLLNNEKLRLSMREKACLASRQYDVSVNVKQLETLYERLLTR